MAYRAMSIEEILVAIEVEADRLANEEMSAPDFEFKCIGAKLNFRGHEISHLPVGLQKLCEELLDNYELHLRSIESNCYRLKVLKMELANVKHVRSEIESSPASGMCVGVHHGAVDGVKSALKAVKGKVRYYKRLYPDYRGEETGVWHVAMDQETATKCKLFGWLDDFVELNHLTQLSWSEYGDPKKFVRK